MSEIGDILKRVHTMGMSDQLIGIKEEYSEKQLAIFEQAILQVIAEAIGEDESLIPTIEARDYNRTDPIQAISTLDDKAHARNQLRDEIRQRLGITGDTE